MEQKMASQRRSAEGSPAGPLPVHAALQAQTAERKIEGMKEENGGYRYWVVQCDECDKLIPLRRYHGFASSWPQHHFEVHCECKFIGNYHRAEIRYATLPALIPREQLPKIKAVQPAPLSSDDVSSVAAPNSNDMTTQSVKRNPLPD